MTHYSKKIEQKTLLIGVSIYFILSLCSYVVYFISGIEAMFLDASFSMISTLSTLFAMFISKYSAKKSSNFPNGLFVLEPSYGIVKSLLILSITALSCIQVSQSAYSFFMYGKGELLNFKPIIPYSILCTISCLSLHFLYKRKNMLLNNSSTMLSAESRSTLLDGVMCCGIGILAIAVSFITKGHPLDFLLYTGDFFVTLFLSLIMIKEPFLILKQSFSELASGSMSDSPVKSDIIQTVKQHLSDEFCHHVTYSVIKTGMNFRLYFVVDKEDENLNISDLWRQIKIIDNDLSKKYEYFQIEINLN